MMWNEGQRQKQWRSLISFLLTWTLLMQAERFLTG